MSAIMIHHRSHRPIDFHQEEKEIFFLGEFLPEGKGLSKNPNSNRKPNSNPLRLTFLSETPRPRISNPPPIPPAEPAIVPVQSNASKLAVSVSAMASGSHAGSHQGEEQAPSFEPPKWTASNPKAKVTLTTAEEAVNASPECGYVTIGRSASCTYVPLGNTEAAQEAGISRLHAAVVHHTDGRVYVIDLHSAKGTTIDGKKIDKYKPTSLKHGAKLVLGQHGSTPGVSFRVSIEGGGSGAADDSPSKKRAREDEPATVRASHLLVKHNGSRRPSSWKEPVVTRSLEEAKAMVQGFRDAIVAKAQGGDATALQGAFEELASVESHCSSAKRGGDLGPFGRGQMQRQFETATYALQVGEISDLVFSDSGVHIILRTE